MKFNCLLARLSIGLLLLIALGTAQAPPAFGVVSQTLQNLQNGVPQHIVTYGTSLTDAKNDNPSGAWVQMMADELESLYPGLATVTNSGEGGMDSTWALPNLQSRVLDFSPDTVFIEFAINDAIAVRNIPVSTAKSNLESMIDQIQAQNANCEIILMTMTHPGAEGLNNFNRPNLDAYYDVYRTVSAERSLTLIDHDANWLNIIAEEGAEKYLSYMIELSPGVRDETHPNVDGCREVVFPAVMEGLQSGEPYDPPQQPGGLVAHYQFDGNLNDSVSGTAATAVGSLPEVMYVDGPEGIPGQAIDLGGSDWYVNCGSDLNTGNDALTVTAWIYDNYSIPTTDHNYCPGIVMRDGFRDGDWGLRRYSFIGSGYTLSGRAQMLVGGGNDAYALSDEGTVPSGQWVHLAATYETTETGSEINLYIDGVLAETATFDTPISFGSLEDILIGYDAEKDAYFDGLIADVRVYADALDATDILDIIMPKIPGDANGDGKVDGSDVTILANNWQYGVGMATPDGTWAMGDFNGDGKIDGSDVTILANNWQYGTTVASSDVPEPSVVILIMSSLVVFGFFIKRGYLFE